MEWAARPAHRKVPTPASFPESTSLPIIRRSARASSDYAALAQQRKHIRHGFLEKSMPVSTTSRVDPVLHRERRCR